MMVMAIIYPHHHDPDNHHHHHHDHLEDGVDLALGLGLPGNPCYAGVATSNQVIIIITIVIVIVIIITIIIISLIKAKNENIFRPGGNTGSGQIPAGGNQLLSHSCVFSKCGRLCRLRF